ncbi:putative chromate transport protein [Clostridium homopropionicum DSM 5847]|uniref:Putative chromate transport protein n=1 Tax=Clostridium homopropionicum DSM 5847 TaxID=1121318 RepID=A0A0L6ZE93_9CLOT|nr:chromate transporter [Clostridium homopropionicum]KOA21291.1 putative chromate transport protein [Clostridium homopropionicum DSM 5847]SFG30126.1 chromate transporter [Clostridium homopropionicum]
MKLLINLYLTFLKIGMFSFGGGYAMLPFIEKEVLINHKWIDSKTFIDIIGISQMTPGPVAINSATFIGYRMSGILGSIAATLGVVSFSFLLVSIASHYVIKFKKSKHLKAALLGMRPALIGLIISAFLSLAKISYNIKDFKSIIIGTIIGFFLFKTKLHPILIILLSGFLGIIFWY